MGLLPAVPLVGYFFLVRWPIADAHPLSSILVWSSVFAPHYLFLARAPYIPAVLSEDNFLSSPSHPAFLKSLCPSFAALQWLEPYPHISVMSIHVAEPASLADHIFFHVLHAFVYRHLRETPWHDDFPERICGFLMLHSTYFSRNLEPQEDGNWSSGTSEARY